MNITLVLMKRKNKIDVVSNKHATKLMKKKKVNYLLFTKLVALHSFVVEKAMSVTL